MTNPLIDQPKINFSGQLSFEAIRYIIILVGEIHFYKLFFT